MRPGPRDARRNDGGATRVVKGQKILEETYDDMPPRKSSLTQLTSQAKNANRCSDDARWE
jgi:hypothetical protein